MRRIRANLCNAVFAACIAAAMAPVACAQIAALDKGHQLLVDSGLQIWGLDQGASGFNYNNLANANFNGVMWSWGVDPSPHPKLSTLTSGQKWGKWQDPNISPASALDAFETSKIADLLALQVGDEQQSDLENPNGVTKAWFQAAHAGNYFPNQLLYVNSFYIGSDGAYATFIADANPDAISFDSYPFDSPYGSVIYPHNWLSKAGQFRRHALGSYLGLSNNAPRPYGMYLQTYQSTSEGTRHPSDVEMRWQQFTAWTMGFTFVDAFTVGGSSSLFNGGNMGSPSEPRYSQFKESARQSMNLGPALVKLISYGYGPSIAVGKNAAGASNIVPSDWLVFNKTNAPPNQQYLTSVSATNIGTKNNGQPGDVYIGFFNPLLASYGDPAGTAYFMVTNALGPYLDDPSATVADCMQRITLDFNFGASGINSLQRLSRDTGQVEIVPLAHVTGSQYRLIFDLEGGTGDLFKYNDGSPFVGIELPLDLLYWDDDGVAAGNNIANGAGLGGGGTWNTSASKWFDGSSDGPWIANKAAVFWGTAGTVTLAAPQSANRLQFKSNGYTVNTDPGSTLTISGSEISVDSGMTATINATLAGSAGINKTGSGTLILGSTSSTYTGGTRVSAGVLRASADGNLGAVPGGFAAGNIILNGGTLRFGASFDINNNRGITLAAGGGTIDTQGFTNPSGYNAFQGGFQGDGDLTKLGSGTFFAAATTGGANTTWKGRLILKEGTWKIVASDGLPYNAPLADGLQPAQVTLDGGTWQIGTNTWSPGQTLSITNARRGITVAAGGGTIDTQAFNFTWAGPLAGSDTSAVLTKIGSGILRFTGVGAASTYNGIVNVNAGTLRLDNGNTMGSLATINLANAAGATLNITGNQTIGSLGGGGASGGNVALSAITLTAGGNNKNTTFAGVISGGGGLTKTGSGTMILTGANTYTGATTVSGGTLRVNNTSGFGTGTGAVNVNGGTLSGTGTIAGAVTVNSGGHLAPGASAGTLSTSSNMAFAAGAVLDYELANDTTFGGGINDLLSITGDLTLGGSLTLNIDAYQGDLANGTYKLITYTGGLTGGTSGWTIGSNNASGAHGYTFSTDTPHEIQMIVVDAAPIWTGEISASWDTGGNWQMSAEPTSAMDIVFPTPIPATGATITLTSGEVAKTLTFNDSYTFSGGSLNVAAGTISVANGKTATIGSVLTGSAGIAKSGAGTLVLGGANSYSGGTSINAGTLRVATDSNLGNSGGGITFGGGTLNATTSFSSARAVTVNSGGGTIDNAAGITTSLTDTIGGAAGNTLTKTGSGTLILAQSTPRSGLASSWLGNITVSGGTLKVGNGGSTGFLPGYDPIAYAGLPPTVPTISLGSGTTLEFNHAAGGATQNTTNAVVISGTGNVLISGAKTEVFVANNTYTGSTTINTSSSLRIGWGGALNTGGLGATAIANDGALTFSNDHNTVFLGSISGTGTLLKEFNGTLVLLGTVAHSGGTTISGGTLQVGNGGTLGSISGNIINNANLTIYRSTNLTFTGAISGTGSFTKRGASTLVFSGPHSYGGGTTISGGTLLVNNSTGSGVGGGDVTVNSGGTLGGSGVVGTPADTSNVIVNSGGHIAPGSSAGMLTINGDASFAASSIFDIELGGLTAGSEFDQLVVNGAATLGGTLNVSLISSFTPAVGNSFEILSATGGRGSTTFSNEVLPSLPPGIAWQVAYNPNSVVLTAVSNGDYNYDNVVDAADYVVWRKSIGMEPAYEAWSANFGQVFTPGAGSNAVPEPRTWLLLGIGGAMLLTGRFPLGILAQRVAARK